MSDVFLKIVNMSISAGWIVLAVILLRLPFKKAPKWINCILWSIVGLRLIMPFSFESIFSLIPSTETISKAPDLPRPYFESGLSPIDYRINEYLGSNYYEGITRPTDNFNRIISMLCIIWIIGMSFMLLYSISSYIRLKKKVGTAVLKEDNIYQSENIASPFVLGFISPKIYMPFNVNKQDSVHIIAHEKAHIRRGDHLWKPLGFLLLTVHWFNPLIWIGYVLLCKDIELACDESVASKLNQSERADYSQALLNCSVNKKVIAACPLAFGESGVKSRVKTVLNFKKPAIVIVVISVVIIVAVGFCFLSDPPKTTLSNLKAPETADLFNNVSEIQITIPEKSFDDYYTDNYEDHLDFLKSVEISKTPISKSRSTDRAKDINVILKYGDSLVILRFDKECKEIWIDNGIKPSFSYRILNSTSVKDYFGKINQSETDIEPKPNTDDAQEISPLDMAIRSVLKDIYRSEKHDGLLHIETYHMLAHETASGTPKLGETGHFESVRVYLLVYHMKYFVSGQRLEETEGGFTPTIISFSVDENGTHTLTEYWTPSEGENYEKDIRAKFPENAADNVLITEKYAEALIKDNWRIATAHLNQQNS